MKTEEMYTKLQLVANEMEKKFKGKEIELNELFNECAVIYAWEFGNDKDETEFDLVDTYMNYGSQRILSAELLINDEIVLYIAIKGFKTVSGITATPLNRIYTENEIYTANKEEYFLVDDIIGYDIRFINE